jgi:hypothetical protein
LQRPEASANDFVSIGDAGVQQNARSSGDDMRLVEKDANADAMGLEN